MNIFLNTQVTFFLSVGHDLAGATGLEIHYKKPDGSVGEWTGLANGQKIEYTTSTSDLDQLGTWEFQSVAVIDGNLVKGTIVKQNIKDPIKTT